MLGFEEREKPEYLEKNLTEQRREPTTNSTHIWRRVRESNPGHISVRRALSPLRHLCSPRGIQCTFGRFLTDLACPIVYCVFHPLEGRGRIYTNYLVTKISDARNCSGFDIWYWNPYKTGWKRFYGSWVSQEHNNLKQSLTLKPSTEHRILLAGTLHTVFCSF